MLTAAGDRVNAIVGVGSGRLTSIVHKRSRKATGPDRPGPHTRHMADRTLRLLVEASPRKVFVVALDWPGLARAGKDEPLAVDELLAHLGRYRPIAEAAGLELPGADLELDVVERVDGGGGTAFGVPSEIVKADREPTTPTQAKHLAALVEASWAAFDRIADAAPASLRKGPRGGGRDTAKVVDHVNEADSAYAREMGLKHDPKDRAAVEAMRAEMLQVLRTASDGSPLAGRRWTARYAARRVAWHALDHAWEIEDRTEA